MEEKSVFITGAATGIGEAIALKLDHEGWKVFGTYHRSRPDDLIKNASGRLTMLQCDVGNPEDIINVAKKVEETLGGSGLNLLISNAAMTGAPGPLECLDIDKFHGVMEVNFWAPLHLCQEFLPLLRKTENSRIIIVTSTSIYMTIPLGSTYPISKSALDALTRHLRMEMEPFDIQVTALEPGGVKTKMTGFSEEEKNTFWDAFTPDLLPLYKQYFSYPGDEIAQNFELWPPARFAEQVYKKIIQKNKWKPKYIIGPGVSALPILHRFLSIRRMEKFFQKLFGVKF